jgi:hypothetical protein
MPLIRSAIKMGPPARHKFLQAECTQPRIEKNCFS